MTEHQDMTTRLAERRKAREDHRRAVDAARDIAAMGARMGDDAVALAALAAVERGQTDGSTIAQAAIRGAEEARQRAVRTADATAARDAYFATGRMLPREGRDDATARVVAQYDYLPASTAREGSVIRDGVYPRMVRGAMARAKAATTRDETAKERALARDAASAWYALPMVAGWRASKWDGAGHLRDAVAAAVEADREASRPDHDAATCNREACSRCATTRGAMVRGDGPNTLLPVEDRTTRGDAVGGFTGANGAILGPLARPGKRARRGDRAPREVSTGRDVIGHKAEGTIRVTRDASLLRLLDRTASMGATTAPSSESSAPPEPRYDVETVAAILATVETVGRRGSSVDFVNAATRYGLTATECHAWKLHTAATVLRDAPYRPAVTFSDGATLPAEGIDVAGRMRLLARAAGIGTADLATAVTALEDRDAATVRAIRERARFAATYRPIPYLPAVIVC